MPKTDKIVINTAPLISIVAAVGNLEVLRSLYAQVLVPFEVCQEVIAGGTSGFAVPEFEAANWLEKSPTPLNISSLSDDYSLLKHPPTLTLLLDLGFSYWYYLGFATFSGDAN